MEHGHPQTPILNISVPSFRYNSVPVLHHVEISLDRPLLVALIGPNGSGKSTLLKIAGGLLRAEGIAVSVQGKPIESLSFRDVAGLVARVPQRAEQVFAMTVREMVRVGRYLIQRPLRPLPGSEEARIDSALESTGIGHLAGTLVAGVFVGVVSGVVSVVLSPAAAPFVLFSAIVLALLVRPAGLFSRGGAT